MRGFIGLCLLLTGLSIGAYSHYPGPAHREASLVELTEIITGAIHKPSQLGAISRSANAAELKTGSETKAHSIASPNAHAKTQTADQIQRRGWFANSKILTAAGSASPQIAKKPILVSPPTRIAAHQKPTVRVLKIKQPPTLVRPKPTQPALSSGWRTAVVHHDAGGAPVRADKRPSSLKPKTSAERWQLVKSLQSELKRVGCYWGRVDGVWGKGSKWAMVDFMKSVNAALPTKDPDYIQLQLVSSHTTKICGRSKDGVQIAAHTQTKVGQQPRWRTKVARVGDHTRSVGANRIVTGTLPAKTHVAVAKQPRRAPLPGRMAVGVLDSAPALVTRPTHATRRHANAPSRPGSTLKTANKQQLKISALAKPKPELDLEGQQLRNPEFDTDQRVREPSRSKTVNPFVAKKRSAAKIRRAKALRKASVHKKRRRKYRRRYRRRSVQSLFTHPLGRR